MTNNSYVAVIFTNRRTGADDSGYFAMADRMDELARQQSGYVDIESVRGQDGTGITVSYWADDEAARAWKQNAEHLVAQELGRTRWYDSYRLRVARVEREYSFARPIFHMALTADWEAAQEGGEYAISTRGITVEHEGFMHCSFVHQMRGVAERFYADIDEIVILHVDREAIDDDLRIEPAASGVDELFPHIYRTLRLTEITGTTTWRRDGEQWGEPPVSAA